MAAPLELVLAEITQGIGAVERLAKNQVRQAPVVLDELLLGRLLGGNRRDGFCAVVVGIAFAVDNGDRVVAVEAEATGLLLEAQPVFLEVDQQRLIEAAALERRRGRRHLKARKGLAAQLEPHDLDGAQRLGAAIRLDRPIEHSPCLRLRAFRHGFRIVGGGSGSGGSE